jgi:hypothetical protein
MTHPASKSERIPIRRCKFIGASLVCNNSKLVFLVLDYLDADNNSKTLSLFLLVTITLLNAVWRVAGVLAARIELMLMSRQDHDKPES